MSNPISHRDIRYRLFRDIALSGLFVALTAVGALIAFPLGPVPFTLQVVVVLLSGYLLGARRGAWTQTAYIALGLIGFPIFAMGRGGFGMLISPTFGYLVGFPLSAFLVGVVARRARHLLPTLIAFIVGIVPIYLFGVLYLWFIFTTVLGKPISLAEALKIGVLPFIPLDILKAVAASLIGFKLKRFVKGQAL